MSSRLLSAFDRMLSKSVVGTLLVLFGGAVVGAGLLYGLALGVPELLASSSAPRPAGNSGPLVFAGLVVFSGAAVVTLGGQLVGFAR